MAKITKKLFGTLPGNTAVYAYTMQNAAGAEATIITYGARIQSFCVPDREGKLTDIVLGFDDLDGYLQDTSYMGAIVGRNANRIQDGHIHVHGVTYQLEQNDGPNSQNSLHSGKACFRDKIWGAAEQDGKLVMSYFSPDGDGGFPGNFFVHVTYELNEANGLSITYDAQSDAATVCNMTNHSYFNLNGCDGSLVLDHNMQIFADSLTENSAASIATGKIYPAEGTPMDFRQPTPIGKGVDADFYQVQWGAGYDHNWILSGPVENGLRKAALAESPKTGITLTVYTDMPGVQFYSANYLDGTKGKKGVAYPRRSAFCLETQYFPNHPAHPEFSQPIIEANQLWHSVTVFQAGVEK